MSEITPSGSTPDNTAQPVSTAMDTIDWPYIVERGFNLIEKSTSKSVTLTSYLLALIVLVFGTLSGIAIFLDHVDTAEKLMIGLISFLGGAAMFNGSIKK